MSHVAVKYDNTDIILKMICFGGNSLFSQTKNKENKPPDLNPAKKR